MSLVGDFLGAIVAIEAIVALQPSVVFVPLYAFFHSLVQRPLWVVAQIVFQGCDVALPVALSHDAVFVAIER